LGRLQCGEASNSPYTAGPRATQQLGQTLLLDGAIERIHSHCDQVDAIIVYIRWLATQP
jgi:hypothetical protein